MPGRGRHRARHSMSAPEGRGAAWTEERGTSDEGRGGSEGGRGGRAGPRRRAGDTVSENPVRPVDTEQAVVDAVRDLLPVLRERAQETEDARVVPAESVKALAETGFFRLLQPARFGGYEADPITFLTEIG